MSSKRPTLKAWMKENWPDPEKWCMANAAQDQIIWVRISLARMAWNSLLPRPIDPDKWTIEAREATMTVDGTHTSKSVCLPVYRFDIDGVTTKIRGNFHDWCVRCYTPMAKPFPEWMHIGESGCFEGMETNDSPVSFCVPSREKLYAVLWWLYAEGLGDNRS